MKHLRHKLSSCVINLNSAFSNMKSARPNKLRAGNLYSNGLESIEKLEMDFKENQELSEDFKLELGRARERLKSVFDNVFSSDKSPIALEVQHLTAIKTLQSHIEVLDSKIERSL